MVSRRTTKGQNDWSIEISKTFVAIDRESLIPIQMRVRILIEFISRHSRIAQVRIEILESIPISGIVEHICDRNIRMNEKWKFDAT